MDNNYKKAYEAPRFFEKTVSTDVPLSNDREQYYSDYDEIEDGVYCDEYDWLFTEAQNTVVDFNKTTLRKV